MTTTPPTTERQTVGSGIAVIDKPAGWTSHRVVARVRKLAGTRKVGHAGTLDPMATGVLVVGIDRATRLLGHLTVRDKEYLGTIRLGISTLTDDAEGDVTQALGAGLVTRPQVEAQLGAFRGEIIQVPTAVSAIKVNGVRSYARVRAGEAVTLAARPVTISRYELLDYRPASESGVPVVDVDVVVECSSGTYVRALARDLGTALGSGGHLTALRRIRVGPFRLDQAQSLDQAAEGLTTIDISDVARQCFPVLTLDGEQAEWVRHGRRLPGFQLAAATTALLSPRHELLALYRPAGLDAVPICVFTN